MIDGYINKLESIKNLEMKDFQKENKNNLNENKGKTRNIAFQNTEMHIVDSRNILNS